MATKKLMQQLYARLAQVGFSRTYIHEFVLPSEYKNDTIDESKYQQILNFLSQHLHVSIDSLKDPSSRIVFDDSHTRFFRGPEVADDVDAGLHVAEGVARVALEGMDPILTPRFPAAAVVRRSILNSDEPWVSFHSLLTYCWKSGVPVLHVSNLPPKAKKLRGVAIAVNSRPAIVLCQQFKYPSRHLNPLAHELGHLAGEHLGFIGLMASIEEEMNFNYRTEAEAHSYATTLLTGGQVIPPDYHRYRSVEALVESTRERGRRYHVDPGYLIVNRASHTGNWIEANIALGIIEGHTNAIDLINAEVCDNVHWDKISRPSRTFFQNVTGASLDILSKQRTMTNSRPVFSKSSQTLELFSAWAKEDITDDSEDISRRQQEGDTLLKLLDRSAIVLREVALPNDEMKGS